MSDRPKPRVPTILKVGELFAVFTTARPRWKLHELAKELGWDVATTHRVLKALVEIRMLDYGDDETYSVGLLPLELAAISDAGRPRRRDLLQRIERISEESGLTTQIGALERDAVAIVASHESRSALRAAAMLGERLPLHATAVGKVILSQLPDEEIEQLLPERLESLTSNTVTSRDHLIEQVREARESGFAHADGELSEGLYALAIAIPQNYFSSQLTGLTCAGISREITPAKWEIAAAALRQQAEAFGHWTTVATSGATEEAR